MTTKRLQTSLKPFERSMKKPKLDINVNKSRTIENVIQNKDKVTNFWDDDDDDVILLASQMADTVTVTSSLKHRLEPKQNDSTFMEFHEVAATSTQKPTESVKQQIITQLLDDDEGDNELLAVLEKEDSKKRISTLDGALTHSQKSNKNRIQIEEFTEFILSENSLPSSATPPFTQNTMPRRQLATEQQMKFLMDKINALKKENANLSKSLVDSKTKMQAKTGECTMLRDELRHIQQELKNNKMEKILHAETTKNECQTKIIELSKKIVAQETELQLRQVECSKIKTKYAEETQKLQQSMLSNDASIREDDCNVQVKFHIHNRIKDLQQYNKWLLKMRNVDIRFHDDYNNRITSVPGIFYEHSEEKSASKKQKTIFELQLRNIQHIMAQLQLTLNNTEAQSDVTFLPKCIESSCKMFSELWSYCYSLEYSKKCHSFPYNNINNDYINYSKQNIKLNRSTILLKPITLFEKEKAISLRRYVSALTIICQKSPNLTMLLLESKQNDYYLLQIISDALKKLSYARDNTKHFGVLEAIAAFLRILVALVPENLDHIYIKMIVDLLKQIIFMRPSNWILLEVSLIFLECNKRLPQILNYVCVNSAEITYVTDRVTSNNRFTNEACIIQVYTGLLGIAFPTISKLDVDQFHILIQICSNHIRFAYECFTRPSKFIQKNLHFFNTSEDEDKENDTSINGLFQNETDIAKSGTTSDIRGNPCNINQQINDAQMICKCYSQFCRSVVTLLFQTLRQWILHEKEIYTNRIGEIFRLGIHLMHLIFCENHSIYLLRDLDEISKHHLQFMCQWLIKHKNIFKFNAINVHFLKDLQNSHIMLKYISVRCNMRNIADDLLEWSQLFKFDENCMTLQNYTEDQAKISAYNLVFGDDTKTLKIL